jgi:toxin YoeB
LRILEEISQTPYGKGLGKPEPLKHNFSGWWSRQISGRYRIIYQVASSDTVRIARCKYDYHKSS